ncbi:protein subunit of ribonuclease P [Chondrocystis sp. NIES-4102]|nr:protein subunit of ribonuclease P [Chondrocystis sp. NIES-4102]
MGLPLAYRLRNRHDYRTVYEQGLRRYSPHLTLIALAPSDPLAMSNTMFGISIGKKVSKKAVIRNRLKRQIKGVIRTYLLSINPGWKVIIIVKPQAIECKYEHFLRELEELLKQAKIINGH